jgi:anti-sigma regulatory factor (Ser/Thr protein kinase)
MMPTRPTIWPPETIEDAYLIVHEVSPGGLTALRLFAASVARSMGSGEEQAADLKLAVSEACTNAVQAGISDRLAVELSEDGGAVSVRVGVVDRDAPGFLGFGVIEALFGTPSFLPLPEGGWVAEFSFVPVPGPSGGPRHLPA